MLTKQKLPGAYFSVYNSVQKALGQSHSSLTRMKLCFSTPPVVAGARAEAKQGVLVLVEEAKSWLD